MSRRSNHCAGLLLSLWLGVAALDLAAQAEPNLKNATWAETLLATRASLTASSSAADRTEQAARLAEQVESDFPIPWDWTLQDFGPGFTRWFLSGDHATIGEKMMLSVLAPLGDRAEPLRQEWNSLRQSQTTADDARWLNLYVQACERRRALRLKTVLAQSPRIVFTKHRTIRPSFFAYTEGQSDAQHERHFLPGAALCLLEMDGLYGHVRTLLEDPHGAIRDPAVSWDGQRVLFAWKKSLDEDDYHLYELQVASGRIRQITSGLGFADYEPAYLPNGDIIFASTRCVQTVDCWWTEVSNLYTCDSNGRFLRRLGFDQVHTVFPQVLSDGRVIYTRWDYNDRGQVFPQPLFVMNPDGTGQTEFYGNDSWFPTTLVHARGIPGTEKVVAVLCGHHTTQAGKLAIIDPSRGRHENEGVRLIAPIREAEAERIDAYGQDGPLFQYPYPLNDHDFLVTYAPLGWDGAGSRNRRRGDADFAIYWMNVEGDRELLASDPRLPCQQPVPLAARPVPPVRPNAVDYRQHTGTYYVQDVYAGPGLAGVPRGMIKKLRVVALEFRPAGVGHNGSGGPGGGALISTPIAIGNGSWDVKVVLGDTPVYEDGSAFFIVPARTPVYFQALDANNRAVQTMRSWSTLQPGENQSCVGCHEHKNSAPQATDCGFTLALQAGPQTLIPFYGPPRGFSFPQEIQPILDRNCISCHNDRSQHLEPARLADAVTRESDPIRTARFDPSATSRAPSSEEANADRPVFSLLRTETLDAVAQRYWSDAYLNLTLAYPDREDETKGSFRGRYDGRIVNWIGSQSIPAPLPPYAAGSTRSGLISLLERGHYDVQLSREEFDKLACWIDLYVPYCGDYTEANAWNQEETQKYQHYLDKRKRMEEIERKNIEAMLNQSRFTRSDSTRSGPLK